MENEMGRIHSTRERDESNNRNLVGIPEGKKSLGRPKRTCELIVKYGNKLE
jgi:hypothetical protein